METLKITDGTTEINLIDPVSGFLLNYWRPQIPGFKDGGTYRDSPLSDGRRIVDTRWDNVIEIFNLKLRDESQDKVIWHTQELRRLLVKAVEYWKNNWQEEIVWIEAQASCETEKRYAWIVSWRTPEDDNPFAQPFLQLGESAVMDEFDLAIEHGPWLKNAPGESTCVESYGYGEFCFPSYLIFNGDTSEVDCGSAGAIDDLPAGANGYTAEAWVYANTLGEGNLGTIFDKKDPGFGNGWYFNIQANNVIHALIDAGLQDAESTSGNNEFTLGAWHHVAMTYEDAVNRLIRIWIDGVEITYVLQNPAANPLVSDADENLIIGNTVAGFRGWDGNIGWCRLSNSMRYNVNFTPPPRCTLPDPTDANTVAQWIYEGSGTAIDNMEGTAALDGTAANTTWGCDCVRSYGNIDPGCAISFLEFNGDRSVINLGTAIRIDDLPLGSLTAEMWIRANSYGGGNGGRIFDKAQWRIRVDSVSGIDVFANFDVTNAQAASGLDDFTADGQWHHIACTFDGGGTEAWRIWIDGVEVTYSFNIAGANNYVVDNANILYLGNNTSPVGTRGFDGDIGWCRISNNLRYLANFTPPARCTLPSPFAANTIGIWIYEGFGAIADNLEGSAALDGVIGNCVWACDCED